MLRRSVTGADIRVPKPLLHGRGLWTAWVVAIVAVLPAGVGVAPRAFADSASAATFRNALTSARGGTSCGALQSDPIVERVAEAINRSTDLYLDHDATETPLDDPRPGLQALGYGGKHAALLRGVDQTEAGAIKEALLEGAAPLHGDPPGISNCALKDFGVSVRYNEAKGYLTSAVLAGP